jgi:L-malate glycosyltransferase
VLGGACRASDVVVANARAVAAFTDHGLAVPEDRLAVINNGIDVAGFDREALLEPDPPIDFLDNQEDRRFTVAVVANMNTEEKGHGDLVRAAAMLAPQGLVLRLLFVGDGAQRRPLEALAAELGIGAHVRFLGRRRDVPRILARVAAACLPSWAEGLPNSVLEAMLAARPVVVTSVGGCPEVINDGHSGLLVPPRDPNRLAEALKRLFQNPAQAAEMGRQARQDVAARFNLRVFMRQYHALYDELGQSVGPHRVEE